MKNSMMKGLRLVLILSVIVSCSDKASGPEPAGPENMAYKWGKVSLECTANDTEWFRPRPTVTSRFLGLIWTAVFDAWTRYDAKAEPIYLKNAERRPESERTLKNKEAAISYAAYRTMMVYYFSDSVMLTKRMKEFGYDPADTSLDPSTAIGIGNLAARSVIEARRNDGSNQMGNTEGCDGKPYSDYTSYRPVNSADTLNDLIRWQPKFFADGKGGHFCPPCLTPQWGNVKPLLLDSASQFRPPPPPAIGSEQLAKEVKEVIELQANLTNEQKALVEFMRDGPKSVQQAGHWLIFAQNVSVRDKHTLDQDVKMYFLVEAAAMDAFIACWEAKMYYDYARPYSLVHDYYRDKTITGWGGPDKGMVQMKGQEWRPYSPETFLCPPFPAYVSGHSTISGACADILRLYKGVDHFGEEVTRTPGALTEPDHAGPPVVLKFPTFTETANMAGISRVMGGYHIQADNVEGLKLGRNVASVIWQKYLGHIK
jgi:hypothetical protein